MIKEFLEDGGTLYEGLYSDEDDRTWHILQRKGGSISLYATSPNFGGVGVVYDTIDIPVNETSEKIIARLRDAHEGIGLLLATLPRQT